MKKRPLFPSSQCHVDVINRQREVSFNAPAECIQKIVLTVLENESEHASTVSIHFLGDRAMRLYHKKFFHDASSTDCMSFPLDEQAKEGETRHLGDIFVCPLTALRYALAAVAKEDMKATLSTKAAIEALFWSEVTLYIVHGMLHLLGYDDIDPASRSLMRRRERSAMARLQKRGISLSGAIHRKLLSQETAKRAILQ